MSSACPVVVSYRRLVLVGGISHPLEAEIGDCTPLLELGLLTTALGAELGRPMSAPCEGADMTVHLKNLNNIINKVYISKLSEQYTIFVLILAANICHLKLNSIHL